MIIAIKLVLFLSLAAYAQPSPGQKTAKLSKLRVSITAEKQPLGIIFRQLMQEYEIAIGFEQSTLDNGLWHFKFDTNMPASAIHRSQRGNGAVRIETTAQSGFRAGRYPISLDIKNGSIKELLDAIVKQMDHYAWEIRDDVINIYPTRGRDARFQELLGLKVKSFALSKGSKVEDITVALLELPEFRQFQKKHRISFFPLREGVTVLLEAQYGRPVDQAMEFKNIRFRDLLNRITKIKKGGWILRMRGKTREGGERGDLDI